MALTKNCPVARFAQALEVKGPFGGAQGQVQMVNVSYHDLLPFPEPLDLEHPDHSHLICRFCARIATIAEWNPVLTAPTTTPAIAVPV